MNLASMKYDLTYFKFYVKALFHLQTKSRWKSIQKKELVNILKYGLSHSDFFRDNVGDVVIDEKNVESVLKKFPVITKQTILDNRWKIFSDEIPHDYAFWRETGGSTGVPLKFPSLASPYYIEDVCQLMLYHQMGFSWGDTIVYFGGDRVAEDKLKKHEYWFDGKNLPYGKICYCVRYLDDSTFPYYVDSLNEVSPKFLRGFTSSIKEFCRFVKKENVKFEFKLKGIYLTSESSTLEDRKYIESILHCPVWGQYGHTECSIFAVSKPHDSTYYANPLYGFTEILDEDFLAVVFSLSGCVVFNNIFRKIPNSTVLQFIGRNSMEYYVTHWIVLNICYVLCSIFFHCHGISSYCLMVFFSILIPTILIQIKSKTMKY